MAGKPTARCTNCGKLNRVPVAAKGTPRCAVCKTPLPWVVDADAQSYDEAIDSSKPVLVDFWAEWCGPCRMVTPVVEKLAGDFAGRLKVVKLNTDEAPEIAGRYEIRGIPLLVLHKDGKEVERLVGAHPEQSIRQWLEPRLPAAAKAG